ncbi:MAG: hypothetical protein M0Q91_14015 [Methanoregula sp.]|nr:hypothetical protein [Methanoregula sp.]
MKTPVMNFSGYGHCPPCLCSPFHLCPVCPCPACWEIVSLFCPGTTNVILIRHAEKIEDGSIDPSLTTPEGMDRAKELVHVVGNANIAAIYTTCTKRS